MGLVEQAGYCKCMVCGSLFFSAGAADRCCKTASSPFKVLSDDYESKRAEHSFSRSSTGRHGGKERLKVRGW